MRRALAAFALTLLPLGASAADISIRAKDAPAPMQWDGFHAGVFVGRNHTADVIYDEYPGFSLDAVNSNKSKGTYLGLVGGYNFQIGPAVLGVELDHSMGRSASHYLATSGYTASVKTGAISTARFKAGYAIGDLFIYATGGLARAEMKRVVFYDPFPCGAEGSACLSGGTYGAAFGGGLEMMVSKNWSVRADYLRIQLKDRRATSVTSSPPEVLPFKFTSKSDLVRFGLSYHF